MDFLPESLANLINELAKLPGIGPKSAQRLAFYLLKNPELRNKTLGESILNVKEGITLCVQCQTLTNQELCGICMDSRRDASVICVVEQSMDLIAIEKTGEFKGLYHVLHGKISPLDGVGPDDLKIPELWKRVRGAELAGDAEVRVMEVILAMNPDLEGETTALYLQRRLSELSGLKISRLARGLPSGAHLEYADDATLIRAISGRQVMV